MEKIKFRYFADKYVGVFIAHKIGRNFRLLLMTVLCTFGFPYEMPAVVPTGQILSKFFQKFFPHF